MVSRLRRGVFILSLDFELVWGSRDLVDDPSALVEEARITRDAVFEPLLEMLEVRDIRATWATVGHLFLSGSSGSEADRYGTLVPPQHAWRTRPWWAGVPAGTEADHPAWYGRSLVERLRDSHQEIGSHSFSHPIFGDPGCSREAADADLARCVAEARAMGLSLESFVFPRNVHGHVDLLARHGFRCWRPVEPSWFQHPSIPRSMSRLSHLAAVAAGCAPPTVVPVRDRHGLWQIPGSATFLPAHGIRRAIPMRQRVRRAVAGLDRAVAERRVSHLYVHPINFAAAPGPMLGAFERVLDAAVVRRDRGELDIFSMGELARRCEAALG